MNLTQFALLTHRTTSIGVAAADYFKRWATTGDEQPASRREAERVIDFCARVQKATPEVLPGEAGEGNDLWCEANEVAINMRRYIDALDAAAD